MRRTQMNKGEACLCLCTRGKNMSRSMEILEDQVDESYYETVGESNRFKDKK